MNLEARGSHGAGDGEEDGVTSADPAVERWRATTRAKAVAASAERREAFVTTSEIPVGDVYTPADVADLDPDRDLGLPGEYPFTRGVQATMYRSRFWTMRQYAGFATAAETNERFRYLLEQGQTGLSVAFDLPTQMGYDSDAPEAEGEVGRVGVPVSSLADMETLFAGIPLGDVSTSMTINATAPILLALYVAAAEKQGVARGRVSGTTQNDILKEYVARGTWIYPPRASMRLVTDVFEFASRELPRWNTISISGYHMREAGATAAQELAFTLADGIAYVEAAVGRGLAVDDFAPRLSFFFAAWSELFEEVAKFRAARRMWARIMKERFGAQEPEVDDVPLPHPDGRLVADRPVHRQQRRPDDACRPSPRSSAGPRASTRTPGTRRSPCRPSSRPGWPCGPSRSSPTRPASPRPRTRWPAPGSSSR